MTPADCMRVAVIRPADRMRVAVISTDRVRVAVDPADRIRLPPTASVHGRRPEAAVNGQDTADDVAGSGVR